MSIQLTNLPLEILAHIFSYEGGLTNSHRLVCKKFKAAIDIINRPRAHCRLFSRIVYILAFRLTKKGVALISDELPKSYNPRHKTDVTIRVKNLSLTEIKNFRKEAKKCPLSQLQKLFHKFKENVIDTLSDVDATYRWEQTWVSKIGSCYGFLEDLKLPPISYEPKGFEFTDIITKAKTREVARIYFIPRTFSIEGDKDHPSPNQRIFSNYGTEGGFLVSVEVSIKNGHCHYWGMNYHTFFGKYYIDRILPAKLFFGKKEGDSVEFELQGRHVKLICNGNLSPLCFPGNFEEQFKTDSGNYIMERLINPKKFAPPLSHEDQLKLYEKFHNDYTNSFKSNN